MIPHEAEALLFKLADSFQVTLFEIDGKIRGFKTLKHNLGDLWSVSSDMTLCVDETSKGMVTAYARICKNLWAYAVVTHKGQWVLMFDGDKAKLRPGNEQTIGIGNGVATLLKLKPTITCAFILTATKRWSPTNALALLDGLNAPDSQQGPTQSSFSGTGEGSKASPPF